MAVVEPIPQVLRPVREETSRICPATGLRVYAGAQALTLANAVAAVLALAIGGLFGGLIGMSRSPALEFLGPNTYYASLTAHGVAALVLSTRLLKQLGQRYDSALAEELLRTRVSGGLLGSFGFDRNGDITESPVTIVRVRGGGSSTTIGSVEGGVVVRVVRPQTRLVR